jgi:hypothetical protein
MEGLEPPSLAAPDPKSGVSTNFTTPAFLAVCIIDSFLFSNWVAKVAVSDEKK